ncbi:amidase family protein, partial [Salmonella enterica subsp. enterica]
MLITVYGLAVWFNDLKAARPESHGPWIFFVGGLLLAYMLFGWFGAVIKEISLPNNQHAIPAYYVIAPAEASSNLSRFDGVRFGYRCEDPKDLTDLYKRSRGEGFGVEVQRRIMVGAY